MHWICPPDHGFVDGCHFLQWTEACISSLMHHLYNLHPLILLYPLKVSIDTCCNFIHSMDVLSTILILSFSLIVLGQVHSPFLRFLIHTIKKEHLTWLLSSLHVWSWDRYSNIIPNKLPLTSDPKFLLQVDGGCVYLYVMCM